MKVLVLAKGYPPQLGGVESYSKNVAESYQKLGCDVEVLTVCDSSGDRNHECESLVPVDRIRGESQLFIFIKLIWVLLQTSRNGSQFVHATTWKMAIPFLLFFRHPPLIITVHGNEILVKNWFLRKLMSAAIGKAFKVVAVSKYTEGLYRQRFPSHADKVFYSYNGTTWPIEAPPVKSGDSVIFFSVCRLEKRKNIISAVQAIEILSKRDYPRLKYYIAGSGPEEDRIRKYICKEELENIELLGRITDAEMKQLYERSHFFLHPQISSESQGDVEGFGIVIADAMGFGCVPVVGRNGGPAELVVDGRDGIALADCDPTEIADKIERMMTRQNYEVISDNAYKKAGGYTWLAHCEAVLSIFEAGASS